MTTVEVTCPKCKVTDRYGEELIGRYTYCPHCQCRFYVEVPSLAAAAKNGVVREPSHLPRTSDQQTTLDDLLWDTQQGSRYVMQSLARQEQRLQHIFYGIVVLAILLSINVVLAAIR
jgi:hypothetical protein